MFACWATVSAIHWRSDGGCAGWEADGSQLSGRDVAASLSADWQPFTWQWALQSPAVRVVVHLSGHQRRVHNCPCAQSSIRVAAACCPPQKAPTRVRLTQYYQFGLLYQIIIAMHSKCKVAIWLVTSEKLARLILLPGNAIWHFNQPSRPTWPSYPSMDRHSIHWLSGNKLY